MADYLRLKCQFMNARMYRVCVWTFAAPFSPISYWSGLLLIHFLLPEQTQIALLSRLLHDSLGNPHHNNNVEGHYDKPHDLLRDKAETPSVGERLANGFPAAKSSFFELSPDSPALIRPLDAAIHQPLTISQFLRKKLRWIDLGAQYDWTDKTYRTKGAPPFPSDIADLMQSFFPETKPEVAIVNLYNPGDTLSVHRDVSETATSGLISISLGCDAIFIIGLEGDDGKMKNIAVRLHSGDAVYMSQSARYAWHGVPSILPGTCPSFLAEWPAQLADEAESTGQNTTKYEPWRGWMSSKRINLNIRQLNS